MSEAETRPWWQTEDTDGWVESDYEGVFFRRENDASEMSGYTPEFAAQNGRDIRDKFGDDMTVVITAGPWRTHDVAYEADNDTRRVHLDYYSVFAGTHHIDDILVDLEATLDRR